MIKIKKWFSLIELLVTITIIAILAAILLPALNAARERARAISCVTNLKQISTAVVMYGNDNQDYFWSMPGGGSFWSKNSTHIRLASYLGGPSLEELFALTNEERDAKCQKIFFCPNSLAKSQAAGTYRSNYCYGFPYDFKREGGFKLFGGTPWSNSGRTRTFSPSAMIAGGDSFPKGGNFATSNSYAVNLYHGGDADGYGIASLRHQKKGNYFTIAGNVATIGQSELFGSLYAYASRNSVGMPVANEVKAYADTNGTAITK